MRLVGGAQVVVRDLGAPVVDVVEVGVADHPGEWAPQLEVGAALQRGEFEPPVAGGLVVGVLELVLDVQHPIGRAWNPLCMESSTPPRDTAWAISQETVEIGGGRTSASLSELPVYPCRPRGALAQARAPRARSRLVADLSCVDFGVVLLDGRADHRDGDAADLGRKCPAGVGEATGAAGDRADEC